MPDYSACANKTCPLRGDCARYLMKIDSKWQSFSCFKPENGKCDNQIKVAEAPFRCIALEDRESAP